jgi:uncharacterized GH25 family protein
MKKSLAILAALATLALPVSAQAHRAWLAPTATVLSGTDAWVGFDAGMSNGVFIANVMGGVVVSYKQGGEQKRWRGAEADMSASIPADATDVVATRSASRIETFVTLGAPSLTALAPTGQGIELVPVSHPNDLVSGEAATFKLLRDGQPAVGLEVTIARGGTRYRDNPEELTVTTGADGAFTITWPEPGMYWMSASVRGDATGDQLAYNAQYNGVVEVLP